ncbi:MAG: SGNH/GDSL hydrolase family protein [Planctomycetales bacterium]|nr:SGNH/GDSL hydrolase family protein [Planctomycetales bacterium]
MISRIHFSALCALLVSFGTWNSTTAGAEPQSLETLTAAEAEKLDALKLMVQRSAEMKPLTEKWKAMRKEYQIDRDRFPNERNQQVAVEWRKVDREYAAATKAAMLKADPSIEPLFAKQPRARNAGENATDSDAPRNTAVQPITDVPGLPRVLLIGDSISIGYTLEVRKLLAGKANVHRIPVNGGATEVGLANIEAWLGKEKWDVIHFNFGLHDAKYASPTEQRASREVYVKNLEMLAKRMQATGAKLVFATTTPVPDELDATKPTTTSTRRFDSIPERNKLAVEALTKMGVATDDLYAVVIPLQSQILRPNDVHFNPEGYTALAKAVAASIEAELAKK